MAAMTHAGWARRWDLTWVLTGCALVLGLGCGRASAAACGRLSARSLAGATLGVATRITGGTFSAPDGAASIRYTGLPAFCRVVASIHPASDSQIRFELWLPQAWNGRFLQVGNGGFAGAIEYDGLALGLRHGFAVASTDDGHESPTDSQAAWAFGHPEKVVDFGYRAVHLTARVARSIIDGYYGRRAAHAYFSGCSDGGREGLMEAQRYPRDFDGWVIGAPANDWTRLMVRFLGRLQSAAQAVPRADGHGSVTDPYAIGFFRYFVYDDPHLDLQRLSLLQAALDAREKVGSTLDAVDPDLLPVRASGKKIIEYQGSADPVVPLEYSIAYYRAVERYVGGDIAGFYRLFVVPGMGHCHGGAGPNVFGQALVPGASFDPEHDVLAALIAWVEHGRAPERIVATRFREDDPRKGVQGTGVLCPYPQTATRDRQGINMTAAASPERITCQRHSSS